MTRSRLLLPALALALVTGACDDAATIGPDAPNPSVVTFAPTPGTDTTVAPEFPSRVTIAGHVRRPSAAPGDSTVSNNSTPVAGVTVRLMRNTLVNGVGVSTELARVTSAADGSFAVHELPGGYYLVELLAPSGAVHNRHYLTTTQVMNQLLLVYSLP